MNDPWTISVFTGVAFSEFSILGRTVHARRKPASQLRTEYLRRWCYGAKRSRLQPIKDFVTLVENHWDGIIAWHTDHLSNGLLKGINSLAQAA